MGYFKGIKHGLFVGTIVGLCVAPQRGETTRRHLLEAYNNIRAKLENSQELQKATSFASDAVELVGHKVEATFKTKKTRKKVTATASVSAGTTPRAKNSRTKKTQ